MTIETKLGIGDEIWFMKDKKASNGKVIRMQIFIDEKNKKDIRYVYEDFRPFIYEHEAFSTKEALLQSL